MARRQQMMSMKSLSEIHQVHAAAIQHPKLPGQQMILMKILS
jgi:hypothetical protein